MHPTTSLTRFARAARCGLAALALGAWALACPAQARAKAPAKAPPPARIALTFDDLPGITFATDQAFVEDFNHRLLAGLKRHRIPAIGFVNDSKFDDLVRPRQIALVRAWLAAGMDIGNHTANHESPESIGVADYIADIAAGEAVIRPLDAEFGRPLVWFRHPYLKTGASAADKAAIDSWLTAHGYRIAPVTMNADDWEFAEPYEAALLKGDKAAAAHIRRAYLAYTRHMIGFYRAAAHRLFGRDIAYIMLLHDHRLNADSIDALAAMLKRAGLRPTSLAKAMADPAYQTPDPYVGPAGPDWLERWSQAAGKPMVFGPADKVPADIAAAYNKVDDDNS